MNIRSWQLRINRASSVTENKHDEKKHQALRAIRHSIRTLINFPLEGVGLELRRRRHDWNNHEEFLPFRKTLEEVKAANIPLGEYIDKKYNRPGVTQATIDEMMARGVFGGKVERVCEVGPGSGRYLEKVIKVCSPAQYEIYETASDWDKYLIETYSVVSRPTDGKTLSGTASSSIDLFQAHKVFVCTAFLTTLSYFDEITRVIRDGGKAVFDIVSEDCLDSEVIQRWFSSGPKSGYYPCVLPKNFVKDFFQTRNFSFDSSFIVPMEPGVTEVMIFTKQSPLKP